MYINKQIHITDFFYKLLPEGQRLTFILRANACLISRWWSPESLSLESLEYIINRPYMAGNVPNTEFLTVWLSPHWLLTFRFTVHAQLRVYTASDLSASQVSSVENIQGLNIRLRAHLVLHHIPHPGAMFVRAAVNSNSAQSHVWARRDCLSSPLWVHPDREKKELLWIQTLRSFQITLIKFPFYMQASFFREEE